MEFSTEKKWPSETSTAVLIDRPMYVQRDTERIRHHFVLSLFSALCLCPATGLIALAYSIKSSAKADVKFHDKARLYSRRALFWNILSMVLGVISTIVIMIYFIQLNKMIQAYIGQQNRSNPNDIDQLIKSIANNQ